MKNWKVTASLVIFVVTFSIYHHTVDVPFIFDDNHSILENTNIRLKNLKLESLISAGMDNTLFFFRPIVRPLAFFSFALNYYAGGYDVKGYHYVNIAIHIVNGFLVYILTGMLFRRKAVLSQRCQDVRNRNENIMIHLVSLFSALLFVSHPIQIQAVTYIVQRMTSMSVLFYLLSMIFYFRGRNEDNTNIRRACFFSSFVSWILALGSKEIAVILPLTILICEAYFIRDFQREWLKKCIVVLACISVAVIMITGSYAMRNPHIIEQFISLLGYSNRDFTLSERLLTEMRVLIYYLGLIFWPLPERFNLLHGFTLSHSFLQPASTLISCVVIVCMLIIALLSARKHRIISFCILWFFIHLSIESSFLALELVFEHRLYLPIFGISVLCGCLLLKFHRHFPGGAVVLAVTLICFLCISTYQRNQIWRDKKVFWTDILSKNGKSYRACNGLGMVFRGERMFAESLYYFKKALELNPDDSMVLNNLGVLFINIQRPDLAVGYLNENMKRAPWNTETRVNMGTAMMEMGRYEDAVVWLRTALEDSSHNAAMHYNLGIALSRSGKIDLGLKHLRYAVQLAPDDPVAYQNLGAVLAETGRYRPALKEFRKGLYLSPGNPDIIKNIQMAEKLMIQPEAELKEKASGRKH